MAKAATAPRAEIWGTDRPGGVSPPVHCGQGSLRPCRQDSAAPLRFPHSSAQLMPGGEGGAPFPEGKARVCWALPFPGAGLSQNTRAPHGVAGFIVLSVPSTGDVVQMIPICKEAKHIKTAIMAAEPPAQTSLPQLPLPRAPVLLLPLTLVLGHVSPLQPVPLLPPACLRGLDCCCQQHSPAESPSLVPASSASAIVPAVPACCQWRWPGTLLRPALFPSRSCRAAPAPSPLMLHSSHGPGGAALPGDAEQQQFSLFSYLTSGFSRQNCVLLDNVVQLLNTQIPPNHKGIAQKHHRA